MAHKALAVALGLLAVSPAVAMQPEPAAMTPAPPGNADTRYCLKVDPLTGSNIETTKCWTREKWAEQGVDVDKAWAKDGVRVIG